MFQYFRQTLYKKIIVAYAEAFGGVIAFYTTVFIRNLLLENNHKL